MVVTGELGFRYWVLETFDFFRRETRQILKRATTRISVLWKQKQPSARDAGRSKGIPVENSPGETKKARQGPLEAPSSSLPRYERERISRPDVTT